MFIAVHQHRRLGSIRRGDKARGRVLRGAADSQRQQSRKRKNSETVKSHGLPQSVQIVANEGPQHLRRAIQLAAMPMASSTEKSSDSRAVRGVIGNSASNESRVQITCVIEKA